MYRLLGGPRTTGNGGKSGELQKCGPDKLTEGGSGMADFDEGEGLVSSGILMNTTMSASVSPSTSPSLCSKSH